MWIAWTAAALALTPDEVVAKAQAAAAYRKASSLAEHFPALDPELVRKAADGKVATKLIAVEGSKARKAVGIGVVNVPIGRFESAIHDDASKPMYTKLSFTEVIKGGLCGDERTVFQYLPISMLTDRYWMVLTKRTLAVHAQSGGAAREMTWDSVPVDIPEGRRSRDFLANGMEITFAKGGWWLVALDENTTLVEYWTWTDPGGYVPARLASSMAAGGIDDTIGAMTTLATKGSRCAVR